MTLRAAALTGALVLPLGQAFAAPPAATPITPELIAAATKEGKVVFIFGDRPESDARLPS